MARKRKPEEHENLDRWLVSYADFITLMFAFFVVMYSISIVNEGKYKVFSESLLQAFQRHTTGPQAHQAMQGDARIQPIMPPPPSLAPRKTDAQATRIKKETEKMKGVAKDLIKVMEPLVKSGQVKVTQNSRGIAVEINASVLFSSGQAMLQGESVKVLKAVSKVLTEVDNRIQVEGYSDNAPINNVAYPSNWELSSARASGVVRLFVDNGILSERVVVVGYGENKPVASNNTPEGRARNRRVTIMILSAWPEKVIADMQIGNEAVPAEQAGKQPGVP